MNYRGLTSLVAGWSFLTMSASGLVLYVALRGRYANWTDWTVLGLDKEQWSALHMTCAVLMVVAVFVHLYFNWNLLMSYLRRPKPRKLRLRELGVSALICAAVIAGTVLEAPPFRSVDRLNERNWHPISDCRCARQLRSSEWVEKTQTRDSDR